MKRQVWADEQVRDLVNEEFIPLIIDVDDPDNIDLLVCYDVAGTPITIITDSNGNALQWRLGGIGKSEFLKLFGGSSSIGINTI